MYRYFVNSVSYKYVTRTLTSQVSDSPGATEKPLLFRGGLPQPWLLEQTDTGYELNSRAMKTLGKLGLGVEAPVHDVEEDGEREHTWNVEERNTLYFLDRKYV